MLRGVCGLSGMAAVLAVLAFAVPAYAADATTQCTLDGNAKTNPPIQISGGGGSYTFSALSLNCVGMTKGAPDVANLIVRSTGNYASTVCGTGSAWSAAGSTTLVSGPAKYGPIVSALGYQVDFVATAGILTWTAGSSTGTAGYVHLLPPDPTFKGLPPNPPPGGGDCTKAMHLVGTVTIATPAAAPTTCSHTVNAPVATGPVTARMMTASASYACSRNDQFVLMACAQLQEQVSVNPEVWVNRGAEACDPKGPNAGTSSATTAATACTLGSMYHTASRGIAAPFRPVEVEFPPSVAVNC